MTIVVSTTDPRSTKALALLAGAESWQRGRTRDGRPFWLVPASDGRGYHMVDCRACTCRWGQRHSESDPCSHALAARLRVAQLKAGGAR